MSNRRARLEKTAVIWYDKHTDKPLLCTCSSVILNQHHYLGSPALLAETTFFGREDTHLQTQAQNTAKRHGGDNNRWLSGGYFLWSRDG